MSILAELAADELCAAKHIRPLVVAAELHIAAVVFVEIVEVVGLHYHVVEHALLVAFGTQHIVDREACADLAEKIYIVEIEEPVGIVDHLSFALAEFDKAGHLAAEAFRIVVDIFLCEHFAHIRAPGGVAYHGRATAYEGKRLVARHLQAFHERKSHKMTCREAVGGAVKADVELCLSLIYHCADLGFVCDLCYQTACLQLVVNIHCCLKPFVNVRSGLPESIRQPGKIGICDL